MIVGEDQNAIAGGVQQGIQAQLFLGDLGEVLGVLHGDGGLIGKGSQDDVIVGRKRAGIIAEDEDHPHDGAARDHGQGHAGVIAHAGGVGQFLEPLVNFGDVHLGKIGLANIGELTEQGFNKFKKSRGQAVRNTHAPAPGEFP